MVASFYSYVRNVDKAFMFWVNPLLILNKADSESARAKGVFPLRRRESKVTTLLTNRKAQFSTWIFVSFLVLIHESWACDLITIAFTVKNRRAQKLGNKSQCQIKTPFICNRKIIQIIWKKRENNKNNKSKKNRIALIRTEKKKQHELVDRIVGRHQPFAEWNCSSRRLCKLNDIRCVSNA